MSCYSPTIISPASCAPGEQTGCCPPFDPGPWDDMRLIEAAHATATQSPMLSEERSPWGSDLYINVTGPVPGADVVTLSGTFLTKVYEGPFRNAPE